VTLAPETTDWEGSVTSPVSVAKMPCAHEALAISVNSETKSSSLTIFDMGGLLRQNDFLKRSGRSLPVFVNPCQANFLQHAQKLHLSLSSILGNEQNEIAEPAVEIVRKPDF
jgi:hypothetical protein